MKATLKLIQEILKGMLSAVRGLSGAGRLVAVAAVIAAILPFTASPVSATNQVNLDQCLNGPATNHLPCAGGTYVNGDANANKAHWYEGDFVAYRAVLTGLGAGPHTLNFGYDPVRSSKHAFDYIGSYDATETTSSVAGALHANNNDPCSDVLPAGQCAPSSPVSSIAVPPANLGGGSTICNVPGTFTGSQIPGAVKLFGPANSALTAISYTTQNSGTNGTCGTDLSVSFTLPAGTTNATAVLAWGGHIATHFNWGTGNAALNISGSPYHMFINSLDGAPTSQDHQLDAAAVFVVPTMTTTVMPGLSEPIGTAVYDTATLASALPTASGTVTYKLFPNGTCSGTPISSYTTPSFTNATVPNSTTSTPTAAGSYSYLASYSGDSSDAAATAACEPFTITPVAPGFTTTPAANTISYGSTITDRATVQGSAVGGAPAGTVSFGLCQETTVGTPCTSGGSAVATASTTSNPTNDTLVATSVAASPTGVGTWCFYASYAAATGGNYTSVSLETNQALECFTVTPAGTRTATQVSSGTAQLSADGTITDTVTVTAAGGGHPTGTVDFYVCQTGTSPTAAADSFCAPTGTPQTAGAALAPSATDPLSSTGTSASFHPTSTGTWCFGAVYSGSANYAASQDNTDATNTSVTECVLVSQAPSSTVTTLHGTTGAITGSTVSDSATVSGLPGLTPTGTVSFSLYSAPSALSSGSACAGQAGASVAGSGGSNIALVSGSANSNQVGPLAAGNYGFQATYSGDNQYLGSTGNCEPFSVGAAPTSVSTTPVGTDGALTGSSVSDSAQVAGAVGGFSPAGTVAFTLYRSATPLTANATCSVQSGATVFGTPDTGEQLNSGSAQSASFGPLGAGYYGFEATYTSSDGNFTGSTGNCEPFSVGAAPTATSTSLVGTAGAVTGSTVSDTASVTTTAKSFSPQGSVVFTLYQAKNALSPGSVCSAQTGATVFGQPSGAEALSSGSASSGSFGPLPAGNYGFEAVYTSSDGNFTGSTGNCEPFSVGPAPTSTVTTLILPTPVNTGARVRDTAQVSTATGTFPFVPTGSVTFTLYSSPTGLSPTGSCTGTPVGLSQVVPISSTGTAASSLTAPLTSGFYGYQVTYAGDPDYSGSTASCEPFAVGVPDTATATTVLSGEQAAGPASSQDSATVSTSGGFVVAPAGQVTFTLYSAGAPLSGQTACAAQGATTSSTQPSPASVPVDSSGAAKSPTVTGLPAGYYGWQASYAGDSNYGSSQATCEPFQVLVPPTISADKYDQAPGEGVTVNPFVPSQDQITYQIVVRNSGQIDASGVTVADPVPAGTSVASIGNGGTETNGAVVWTGLAVPAGGSITLTFTVNVSTANANGAVIVNTASYTVPTGDLVGPGTGGSCTSATTCTTGTVHNPVAYPIVTAVKSADPADGSTVVPGQSVTYTVTLSNGGRADATKVTVTDAVPAGTTFASATQGGAFDSGTGIVTWTGITVPAGGTAAVSFTVTVNANDFDTEVIPNTAHFTNVQTPNCDGPTCPTNVVTETVRYPIVTALKSSVPADGAVVSPGDPITYTITLSNSGSVDATGVTVTDQVPAGTTFVSATASGAQSGGKVTWSGITVPASVDGQAGQATVSFTVTVDQADADGQVIPNTASFTDVHTPGCDSAATCDTNTVDQTVRYPIISAAKSSDPADGSVVQPGDTIVYTITLTNTGSLPGSETVTDTVPAGTTFVSASGGVTPDSSGKLTWSGLTVPAAVDGTSGTTSVSFTVTVDTADARGTVIPNTASYINEHSCTATSDSNTCDTNKVQQTVDYPEVTAVKSSDPADKSTVKPGSTVTYTITLSNAGGLPATGVTVTDGVPAGTTFVSAANGGTEANGTVTWSGITVPAASGTTPGTTSVSFTVKVNASDNSLVIPNTASFTDVHTPGCSGAANCPTNTVTVIVPAKQSAKQVTTTTTTVAPTTVPPAPPATAAPARHSALAFTGINAVKMVLIAMFGIGIGVLMVLTGRRRRTQG